MIAKKDTGRCQVIILGVNPGHRAVCAFGSMYLFVLDWLTIVLSWKHVLVHVGLVNDKTLSQTDHRIVCHV